MENKSNLKKYWFWGAVILLVLLIVCMPWALAAVPVMTGLYMRLSLYLFIGVYFFTLGLFGLFTSPEKLLRWQQTPESPIKGSTLVLIARIFSFVLLLLVAYFVLFPVTVGSFNLFFQKEPIETIDDTVVSLSVWAGRGAVIDSKTCTLSIDCTISLRGDPARSLDYVLAPNISIGSKEKFFILPGTGLVLGSENSN